MPSKRRYVWVCAQCWRAACFYSGGERGLCGGVKGVVMPYNAAAALKLEDSQTLLSERAAAYRGEYQLYGYKPADLAKFKSSQPKTPCAECSHMHMKGWYCGCEVLVIADEDKRYKPSSATEIRHCACMA